MIEKGEADGPASFHSPNVLRRLRALGKWGEVEQDKLAHTWRIKNLSEEESATLYQVRIHGEEKSLTGKELLQLIAAQHN